MKTQLRSLAILALAAALNSASAADITGTVTLKGTPPPEKVIPLTPECSALHKAPVKTRFYELDGNKLADVVVVVEGVKGTSSPSTTPLEIDQIGCEYLPYVAAVQVGQPIHVKNSDPFMHNVHTLPSVAGNKEANRAQMPKSPDLVFSFDKPEMFLKFKCDVHPWMYSYVSVFDHPYFAVTGKDGSFTIKNVPDGKYTLKAYHRKAAPSGVSKEVEVKGQPVTADIEIELK